MSKKDLVRDGRLQAPKKRTDRSYLKTSAPNATSGAPSGAAVAEPVAEPESAEEIGSVAAGIGEAPTAAPSAPPPTATAATAASASTAARHSGAARALEQQGVRKRRELDVEALAKRDSDYAKHEVRRIVMFAAIIFIALALVAVFVV